MVANINLDFFLFLFSLRRKILFQIAGSRHITTNKFWVNQTLEKMWKSFQTSRRQEHSYYDTNNVSVSIDGL
ncbi:hypothetical protein C479_03932 [Halovivax asiaticus JCM 14624]|uniref:Uncharacterized protein n=1 Tax=Halovivax asiaticus JCM 14624 TaxID=1227490 RepID=M0BQB2_9EURY|nr:hypothetical protein C479_03932 [Halovivax asiaticus JCM 14624]